MAQHGQSGRIVIDVNPALKRKLYASLALSGSTLKDWFTATAEAHFAKKNHTSTRAKQKAPASSGAVASGVKEDSPQFRRSSENGSGQRDERYKVVSMFSGCGGMDLGFTGGFEIFGRRYRSLPFDITWANDLNIEACKTYERNLGHVIHRGSVWDLIEKMPKTADVIIGGFPCQDISVNGKRAGVNGARSGLYKAMVEAIRRIKPQVFVAENVKALLRHPEWLGQVVNDFEGLGYDINYQLYRAADYGVPQTRERVFFVGTAPGVPEFVPPVPELHAASWLTAEDAIGDLEHLDESPAINHIWSKANSSPEQGNRRLGKDRPGYTIRAECHGNIQFHYRLPRRISMREAARIQSFPDKFLFMSGIRAIERQVGNAVPPVLGWHVANAVLACLERHPSTSDHPRKGIQTASNQPRVRQLAGAIL